MRDLYLVRHGRPLARRDVPAEQWDLDPAHEHEVVALRGVVPAGAVWFSSAEPKALATAAILADTPAMVLPDLGEQVRTGWVDDFGGVVEGALADPAAAAYDGWEPLADTADRVGATVDVLLDAPWEGDLALVGHGTAWTVLVARLTGTAPDVELWRSLRMPDVRRLTRDGRGAWALG